MVSSTVSRVEIDRSRRLIQDSRVRLASAREALQQAREALARQHYLQMVCAWCQQTIRWECCEQADWGQVSHSLCFDWFCLHISRARPWGRAAPFAHPKDTYAHGAALGEQTSPAQCLCSRSASAQVALKAHGGMLCARSGPESSGVR